MSSCDDPAGGSAMVCGVPMLTPGLFGHCQLAA
jgi:hypothetical protein